MKSSLFGNVSCFDSKNIFSATLEKQPKSKSSLIVPFKGQVFPKTCGGVIALLVNGYVNLRQPDKTLLESLHSLFHTFSFKPGNL